MVQVHSLATVLAEHPFFQGLDDDFIDLVTGCAKNVRFDAQQSIFREGDDADHFYILRHGTVALEIHAPGHEPLTLRTLKEGEVLGASWLFPPYRWLFDARARTLVRAIALDAVCLRTKCDANPALGYALMKRFSRVVLERLHATRYQLLDLYGRKTDG